MKQCLLLAALCLAFCLSYLNTKAQDTLVFEDKWHFPVVIEEERETEVFYRRADLPHSPLYVIEKRFITMIQYEDPEAGKEKFKFTPITGRSLDVWVTKLDTDKPLKGVLLNLDDSILYVRKKTSILEGNTASKTDAIYILPYQNIEVIELRRRNKISKFSLWGLAGGFTLGTLTGLLIFEDNPPCDPSNIDGRPCDESLISPKTKEEKSLLFGLASATGGWLAGTIIGSIRVKFDINGKRRAYDKAVPQLKQQMRLQR